MKSFVILVFLLILTNSSTAQIVESPRVDKRVELLSAVFRLAGAREYNVENYKSYTDAIHQHFDPHKNHKAVGFAQKLNKIGVGNSFVAELAIHLDPNLSFRLSTDLSKTTIKQFGGQKNIEKFLSLLKDFYQESKFEEFWVSNSALYKLAESRFEELSKDLRSEWFEEFYGQKFNGQFKIVIGLGNGNNFYGPSVTYPNKSKDVYAIFSPLIDEGQPTLPSNAISFVVHEFNHSFANPIIDKYAKKFAPSAKTLFQKVKKEMTEQSYGTWQIMIYESLVRANTLRYLLKHVRSNVSENRDDIFNKKFFWVDALSDLLGQYESDRKNFPTLESFIPKIVDFFETAAKRDLKIYEREFEAKMARVIKLEPFENNSNNLDSNITELRIIFDKPLDGKGVSINISDKTDEKFPEIIDGKNGIAFVDNNQVFTIKVRLEPNTKYGFILTGEGFQTLNNYPLKTSKITFQTK